MSWKESIQYKKGLKSSIALILVFVISWFYIMINNPCEPHLGFRRCDYYFGFPVPFWLVSDFIDLWMIGFFVIGASLNFLIWYGLLSLIMYKFKR